MKRSNGERSSVERESSNRERRSVEREGSGEN